MTEQIQKICQLLDELETVNPDAQGATGNSSARSATEMSVLVEKKVDD